MANSVHKDIHGPDWPLGNITVATPGTYVSIMANVDSGLSIWAPQVFVPGAAPYTYESLPEYTVRAQQITFQAYKVGGGPPKMAVNSGLIYIVRLALSGAGGTSDLGTVLEILSPGQTFTLGSAALNRNVYNPYRYFIDADTAGDSCQVTLIIQ
jgi:hypothetical protein